MFNNLISSPTHWICVDYHVKEKLKKVAWLIFLFITLQTDDKGVFCTDLSQEYQLAASTFGLSRECVWNLSQQAIDCIFAEDSVKQQLRQKWAVLKPQVLKWSGPLNLNSRIPHIVLQLQRFYKPKGSYFSIKVFLLYTLSLYWFSHLSYDTM